MVRHSRIMLKPNWQGFLGCNESVKSGSVQHKVHLRQPLENKPSQGSLLDSLEQPLSELTSNTTSTSTPTSTLSLSPPSWVNNFRDVYAEDRHFAKHWFWDNFNWKEQRIWIGKFNQTNNLPDNDERIIEFLNRLVNDLNQHANLRSDVYIKFYFSRNVKTNEPEINYLLVSNHVQLPEEFMGTLVNITFERYQLTEEILNKDKDFKKLVNHYLNWSNFYVYYDLMGEMQY